MTTANLSRDDAVRRSELLAIEHYDIELDLRSAPDPAAATFVSTTRVTFTSTENASTFLDLVAPSVEAVEINGRALDPREVFDGNRIAVDVRAGVNHALVRARCAYSRTGEGLHRFVDPVDGQAYLYTQFEPTDARRVFANAEQPDLKASFTFHVLAPESWLVRSNTAGVPTPTGDGSARWDFPSTRRISTYVTAVVAGPYHRVDDRWSGTMPDGSRLDVDLALLCRASLAQHLDDEELFDLTKAGLDYFHEVFEFPYPFGKYDQVFVPEYNLGAMENPGCVTFTDDFVFHAAVTGAERERRANVLLHEMAHMWFGDLVTMRWWDDLWLKESFADFMGSLAQAEATGYREAWTTFAIRRKAWAYLQDQLPTTHPIVADIPDVEAAKLNFDGITYAKGASVLKQLVAYVGRDAFIAGVRAYIRTHAYGNATLADFLSALEAASGRDLAAWSRAWLESTGLGALSLVLDTDPAGIVTAAELRQAPPAGAGGAAEAAARPHVLTIGTFDVVDGALDRAGRFEIDLAEERVTVPGLVGSARPDLVLVNDDDLTYAKVRLDHRSGVTAAQALGTIADSLPRALAWSSLWDAARDGELPARDLIDVIVDQLPGETHPVVLQMLHTQSMTAVARFAVAAERPVLLARLGSAARATAADSEPGSDPQLAWTRLAIACAGADDEKYLRGLLDGDHVPPGLEVDTDLRWAAWTSLAAVGRADEADLDAEVARHDTAVARRQRAQALAARPTEDAKAWAWAEIAEQSDVPNTTVSAIAAGFAHPAHRDLTARFEDRYFDSLDAWWRDRSIEVASRLVAELYPAYRDLANGADPAEHPTVGRTDRWIADHGGASSSLLRLVVEQRDHLVRSLRAQAASATPIARP